MNTDIEKLLRKAPGFTPPAGLRERLIEQIPAERKETVSQPSVIKPASSGWLRRWWPALAPAAVSAACAVVLTAQQGKIRELKANIQTLSQGPATESTQPRERAAAAVDASAEIEQEINRLKELAARLKAEIGQLQQLQTENAKLRAQAATPPELALTPEETESLAKAREKAMSTVCINNLKQFGVAVRTYALDYSDSNAPNILSMSNELSTPKILVCPADTMRQVANGWESFTMANCSYEFLAPSENTDNEPQRILSRCPIHGHIGLSDGSVQSFVARNHPERLVDRGGKLYLAADSPPVQAVTPPPGMTDEQVKMDRERYGLPGATQEQIRKYGQRYGLVQPDTTLTNSQPNTTTNATEEQLRIWKERYGIVPPAGGTTSNRRP